MIRVLALAAFALAFLAGPAAADPVTAFLVKLGASVGLSTVAAEATAGFLMRVGASYALSALSRALGGRQAGTGGLRTTVTLTGGNNALTIPLGRCATSGVSVCPPLSHSNRQYLTYVIALSGAPGATLNRVAVDGRWITLDAASPHADYGTPADASDKLAGAFWVKFYDGSQVAADPMLLDRYGGHPSYPWTQDKAGTGICYAICTMRNLNNVYKSLPNVRFEVDGIPLYDPRSDTTAGGSGTQRWDDPATWTQTDNPAVMTYNILRGISVLGDRYGGEVIAADLPYANWSQAMNVCDDLAEVEGGGTEPRYRAGIEVRASDEPVDIAKELLKSCSGDVVDMGGVWKIRAGGPGLPVMTITDDDVIISRDRRDELFPGSEQTRNAVSATYPDPAALYEPKPAPLRTNAAYEAEDGRRRTADLRLSSVPYPDQVQRLMMAWLEDDRRFRRHNMTLPPQAIILEPLDTISWTSERNGYSAKLFDLGSVTDDPLTLLQGIAAREIDAADYSWTRDLTLPKPAVPVDAGPTIILAPGISVSDELRLMAQQPVGVLIVDVTAGPEAALVEVEYRLTGASAWVRAGRAAPGRIEVIALPDGTYDLRAKSIGPRGDESDFAERLGYIFSPTSALPADVTGFGMSVIGGIATLSWTAATDLDLSHYEIRHTPKTTGAAWSGSTTIIPKVPRPATSVTAPLLSGTYLIKAVDKLGGASQGAALIASNVAGIEGLNAVESVSEGPTFDASALTWDEFPGLVDDWTGLVDDNFGFRRATTYDGTGLVITDTTAPGSAYYDFGTVIDLGARYTSRVTGMVEFDRYALDAATWDTHPGLIDTWPLIDTIGASADIDDINVSIEVALSDDLVSWGAWMALSSSDYTARGYKFRALLETQTARVTPRLTALSATVDMPDRTTAGNDIASGAAAKVVSFAPAFKGLAGLGISAQGMATGDFYEITAKGPSGFTITFKNAAGTAVSRTFDYVAKGYGAIA